MSPRGSQSVHGFFSEEEKQESIQTEDSAPEGARISNQAPEGSIFTMVVIKWSGAIKGPRVKVDGPLCGGLYKEDLGSIVPWSGIDSDANLNCFNWSKEDNDWIVLGDQYNRYFKKWQGPIQNGQLCSQTIKKKIRTESIRSKSSGYIKFNGITREGNPEIPIKSYKDR